MTFQHHSARVFIPDQVPIDDAIPRVTHLGIGAHQGDIEFMAFHGILECLGREDRWFGGVTCTNGAGSSRTGPYAHFSDGEMMEIRHQEQDTAAVIGGYGVMIQLNHPSSSVKSPTDSSLRDDLHGILAAARPEVVYTHNPADKHDTHIGVTIAAIQAMRGLPPGERPRKVIGCEVWRGLDWLSDEAKEIMDVSGRDNIAAALNGVFDSQITGGKRYDLATLGRRAANATFLDSHATDASTQLIFGMDLTPLVTGDTSDIVSFVCDHIAAFERDVRKKLSQRLGTF